jgi:hypothetical protein
LCPRSAVNVNGSQVQKYPSDQLVGKSINCAVASFMLVQVHHCQCISRIENDHGEIEGWVKKIEMTLGWFSCD